MLRVCGWAGHIEAVCLCAYDVVASQCRKNGCLILEKEREGGRRREEEREGGREGEVKREGKGEGQRCE